MLLSLINIGSVTALTAIISLQLSSLMMSYVLSIACVFYRRLKHPETLPKARWSLGRFGLYINGGGLIYSTFVFFWCFWPINTPTALETFNWSSLMFTTIVIISGATYLLVGRRNYVSPVALVRNTREEFQSGVE
jgi:amino acid transporter